MSSLLPWTMFRSETKSWRQSPYGLKVAKPSRICLFLAIQGPFSALGAFTIYVYKWRWVGGLQNVNDCKRGVGRWLGHCKRLQTVIVVYKTIQIFALKNWFNLILEIGTIISRSRWLRERCRVCSNACVWKHQKSFGVTICKHYRCYYWIETYFVYKYLLGKYNILGS